MPRSIVSQLTRCTALQLSKFFESEHPEADQVVSSVRLKESLLKALLESAVHKTVKLFIGYLLTNFDRTKIQNFSQCLFWQQQC